MTSSIDHPGRVEQVGVRHGHLHLVELGDAVDLIVEGHLVDGRLAELVHVDALAVDAVAERDDGAAGGERSDLVAVGVEQLGRLAGCHGREELLDVEVALDQLDLDVAELLLRVLDAGARHLVDVA